MPPPTVRIDRPFFHWSVYGAAHVTILLGILMARPLHAAEQEHLLRLDDYPVRQTVPLRLSGIVEGTMDGQAMTLTITGNQITASGLAQMGFASVPCEVGLSRSVNKANLHLHGQVTNTQGRQIMITLSLEVPKGRNNTNGQIEGSLSLVTPGRSPQSVPIEGRLHLESVERLAEAPARTQDDPADE